MRRKALVAGIAVLLVASGCGRAPSGPKTYEIDVDAASTDEDKFQFSAYFPADLRASGGDTIVFRNRSTEAPHTVTFGVLSDRTNQPEILINGEENPVVAEACYVDGLPSPDLTECPEPELPEFNGVGFWNSGYLMPANAPPQAGPQEIRVELADNIPTGNYPFICILHPFMSGNLQIVADEGNRSRVHDIDSGRESGVESARESAQQIEEPELETNADEVTVTAGWGDRMISVNRYAPDEVEVEAGTTVNWTVRNPYEPHTVTFEPQTEPGEAAGFMPGGVASGSDYTGGYANSGIIGAEGTPFAGEFSLTFTEPGTYEYSCMLHPGQEGVISVS